MQNPNGYAYQGRTVSGTTPVVSAALSSKQWVYVSFQATFSDAMAAGALQIQFSNDVPVGNATQFVPTNWTNAPGTQATAAVTAGASVCVYALPGFVAQYYRVNFVPSAGSGTTTCTFNALFA